jgi:alanyl-tRNA synthetase
LKPLFPELKENLVEVQKILEVEKEKYAATKEKSHAILAKLKGKEIGTDMLIELYDSQGISPEMVEEVAAKTGTKVHIPEDFFAKVTARHAKVEEEHATTRSETVDLHGIPGTEALYFGDYQVLESTGVVQKIIHTLVVLDKTVAYPTSGGQMHDLGTVGGIDIVDVVKQGPHIIHVLKEPPKFKVGDAVVVKIDRERRFQLAQHHTATHIVNVAARLILGRHINQAGAKKAPDKAHLDVTHYQSITDDELKNIENKANEIVKKNVKVEKMFLSRSDAEKKFGMSIYQGGAVPGKIIRIVNIPGFDVEACAGTHLNSTSEIGKIKILKSTKIQDGIVRITFTAGNAAVGSSVKEGEILEEAAALLDCEINQLPGRTEELFMVWKKAGKLAKKNEKLAKADTVLKSDVRFTGDVLAELSKILRTQPEHILNTMKRFQKEIVSSTGA